MSSLIELKHLSTVIPSAEGDIRAVNDVSLSIEPGATLGVVGESGCGKSITGFSVMQLVPRPGYVDRGSILYQRRGEDQPIDLARVDPRGALIRSIRGNEIAMIFQEPMTALNPVYTIGEQISEAVRLHLRFDSSRARSYATEMLARVKIPSPAQRLGEYPHQLSGGLRQRAMIAMALSCNPVLLIADEPTTALDVTVQAQVLDLMKELQRQSGMAIMLITHDMGVIADMADQVVVMYAGYVVESGTAGEIFSNTLHPYTRGLLGAVPVLGRVTSRLSPIPGTVPHPLQLAAGCPFAPRCRYRMESCRNLPAFERVAPDHGVRCWLHGGSHD